MFYPFRFHSNYFQYFRFRVFKRKKVENFKFFFRKWKSLADEYFTTDNWLTTIWLSPPYPSSRTSKRLNAKSKFNFQQSRCQLIVQNWTFLKFIFVVLEIPYFKKLPTKIFIAQLQNRLKPEVIRTPEFETECEKSKAWAEKTKWNIEQKSINDIVTVKRYTGFQNLFSRCCFNLYALE